MSYSGIGRNSRRSEGSKHELHHSSSSSSSDVSIEEGGCQVGEYLLHHRPGTPEYHSGTINAMILQYLDKSGLERTFKTLWSEAKSKGITLPDRMPDPNMKISKFRPEYGAALLQSMDDMDGSEVLEHWAKFEKAEKPSRELLRTSMMMHIFVASIPFRKKQNSSMKRNAIEELRIFLSQNSEELTKDEVCVPLFAFSFVQDPQTNPAFRNVFTKTWLSDLRKTVQKALRTHFETHTVIGKNNCDLSLIYLNYLEDYGIPCKDKPNVKQYQPPSKVFGDSSKKSKKHGHTAAEYQMAQTRIKDLMAHGMCLKQSLLYCQARYLQLIQSTNNMLMAWRTKVQGDSPQETEALASLLKTFPDLHMEQGKLITTDPDEEEEYEPEPDMPGIQEIDNNYIGSEEQSGQSEFDMISSPPERVETGHSNSESDSDISEITPGTGDGSETDSMISNMSWIVEASPKRKKYSVTPADLLLLPPPMEPDAPISEDFNPPKEDWHKNVNIDTLPPEIRDFYTSLEPEGQEYGDLGTIPLPDNYESSPERNSTSAVTHCDMEVESAELIPTEPCPRPPGTYEVTPREGTSSTSIYIPASTEVGCSLPPTPESPKPASSSSYNTDHWTAGQRAAQRIRPGVPHRPSSFQKAVEAELVKLQEKSPRARWQILPQDKTAILRRLDPGNQRTVVPIRRTRTPRARGPSTAPDTIVTETDNTVTTEQNTVEDIPDTGLTSTLPDYSNIIVPKNIIREIMSREKEKKSTFMASVLGLGVVPPDPAKCSEEAETNSKQVQKPGRSSTTPAAVAVVKQPTFTAVLSSNSNALLKGFVSAPPKTETPKTQSTSNKATTSTPKAATKQKSDNNLKKAGNSSNNVPKKTTAPAVTAPPPATRQSQSNTNVVPKGSKSGDGVNKKKS